MGDDTGAKRFLTEIDDSMKRWYIKNGLTEEQAQIDIIDHKPDNFIFGTIDEDDEEYRKNSGPLQLLIESLTD